MSVQQVVTPDNRGGSLHRRVTANMDQRFPDATPEDLERSDNICIICREEMTEASRNKKLACNHVFHLHCLRCDDIISAIAKGLR